MAEIQKEKIHDIEGNEAQQRRIELFEEKVSKKMDSIMLKKWW